MAAAVALAGCARGDEDASADARDGDQATTTVTSEITTTTAAVTTTTTIPPPYSFDGSVPPPPLNNTGEDFEAIYRSLDSYSTWIDAHNPDTALLPQFTVEGSEQYATYLDDIELLLRTDARVYDVGGVLSAIEVVDRRPKAVTLRVRYDADRRILVNSLGDVVDERPVDPLLFVVLLSADSVGRWRLVSVTLANETEVGV